jgi:NAD(P)-dependent dehydrogenase (short-subunit alcohol dehydrogenase family)
VGVGRFDGRVGVVTGAAGGLGSAISRELAAGGARLVIVDREGAALETLAGELGALALSVDVTADQAGHRVIGAALEAYDRVDILVNNAGITRFGRYEGVVPGDWDDVMSVNVRAPFLLSQAFGRALLGRELPGVIINIGSIGGRTANPQNIPYGVSKTAILGLTQQLAVEWGPFGIRVNAVNPGLTTWHMHGLTPDLDVKEQQRQIVPLRRLVEPDDIALAVSFLASDDARCITGVMLDVDGGYLLSLMTQLPRPERFLR